MYVINRIRLKKFTGMHLNEIEEFDMRLKSAITILLGRNGCGKTRLLNVLYPTCPDKTDLRDGGEYFNDSTLDGVNYHFIVRRAGSTLKCTIKNVTENVVVCKDVNPKVYNAKVEDILGITPALKNLLIGNVDDELCRLSTGARRTWFTKLSTSDLTYALTVYKKLKDYSRDLVGAIKHGQTKIAEIKPRVVADAKERETLGDHIKILRSEVDELGGKIREISVDPNIDKTKYVSTLDNLHRVSEAICKLPRIADRDTATIDALVANSQTRIGEARARYEGSQQQLGKLLEQKQRFEYLLKNSNGLAEQVTQLRNWLDDVLAEDVAFGELRNFERFTTEALVQAQNYLNEFSLEMTRCIDGRTTAYSFKVLEEKVSNGRNVQTEIETNISRVEAALKERQHRLEHFLSTESVDCPKCNEHFKPGLLNVDEATLRADIEELNKVKARGEEKLKDVMKENDALACEYELASKIREFGLAYSKDPVLALMFNYLHAEDAFNNNRGKFGGIVSWFVSELERAIEISREHAKWLSKSEQLKEVTASTDINFDELIEDIRAAERVCNFQKDTLDEHIANHKQLSEQRQQILSLASLEADYKMLMEKAQKEESVWLMNEYRDMLTAKRQEVFDNYSMANSRFNEMDEEYRRLTAIEEDVDKLQRQHDTAVKLVRAMSPEKGLLRKYFYRAIVRITDMMNKHINTIWEYPLEVQPCDIDEGDMDYKFPFMCGTNDEPAPDVRNGSAAQREIFNLVFRLTAYKALGLEGYPIALDEPGHAFDEGHRNRLVDFIKALLDVSQHSQAIIVSHNSDVHSRLNSADFVVLNEDGVTPPAIYNEWVKIVTRG